MVRRVVTIVHSLFSKQKYYYKKLFHSKRQKKLQLNLAFVQGIVPIGTLSNYLKCRAN